MRTKINLAGKLAQFEGHWQPRGTPNTGDTATAQPRREI
jgi:hypothetical protein